MPLLEVKHRPSGKLLKINTFWLRDHCRCAECYNSKTKQRKYNLLDLAVNVAPIKSSYVNNELSYEVKWSDGHVSCYNIDFLYDSQIEQVIKRSQQENLRTPWNRALILKQESNLRVSLSDLIASDEKVKKIVTELIRYGIVFVDNIPPNETMTEMAVRRLFPIMKTFFGEMWTFADTNTDHADTAYTKEFLGSHTDNTYFTEAAGLQSLHCIRHDGGTGGENFFVDGLHVALQLKRQNPHAFQLLSTVQVPAEYIEDGEYHKHSAPMIRVDSVTGEIIQLRLNVYDRAVFNTLPQEQMDEFYACLREYLQLVQSEENQWKFKLKPGTLVIFDNWRVFHGRCAYTGARTMTGCYVQRTDFISKARCLGIID